MPKRIVQDVVPPEQRSIRRIPLQRKRAAPLIADTVGQSVPAKAPGQPPPIASLPRRSRFLKWGIIIVALLILGGVFFSVTWIFSSATVTVVPKQKTGTVDTILQTGESISGTLIHTIITSTSTASEIVESSRQEAVERKASGEIVVYNNFSSEPQRLIKNTRFEATDGRIYRIDQSIVIPGQKVESGKKVPGSATVVVYADAAGPEYNLLLSDLKGDFTIPGFKGTARYEAFYARQKSDISGGFSGLARVIDDAVEESVIENLKIQAETSLWNSIAGSLPPDFVTYRSLLDTRYSISVGNDLDDKGVVITVVATGSAVAFNVFSLSNIVAREILENYDDAPIVIRNPGDIEIAPRLSEGESLSGTQPLTFSIKGNVVFVWQFDADAFIAELAGRPKKDTDQIMRKYSAIERAEVTVRPSWSSKYPSRVDRIEVVLELDE